MRSFDVVVVGAGVAGLAISRELKNRNIDFITIEKGNKVGRYGPRIINLETKQKLDLPQEKLIREIKELTFYSPGGVRINKKEESVRGYVVNLADVETHLYEGVKEKVELGTSALDFNLENRILTTSKEKINFRVLIFATGALDRNLIEKLKIGHPNIIFCYALEKEGEDEITTIINNQIANKFYGWVIPLQKNVVEIGFGTELEPQESKNKEKLEELLFSLPHLNEYKTRKTLRVGGGFIPVETIKIKSGGNWLAIGDAVGGEPVLGASIHKCVDEAIIASNVIQKFLNGSLNNLEIYNSVWRKKFGKEMAHQKTIRHFIDTTENVKFDEVFKKLQNRLGDIKAEGLINELLWYIIGYGVEGYGD